jgi:hypothetical protein
MVSCHSKTSYNHLRTLDHSSSEDPKDRRGSLDHDLSRSRNHRQLLIHLLNFFSNVSVETK